MTAVFHQGGWPGVQPLPHGWGCELCVGEGDTSLRETAVT